MDDKAFRALDISSRIAPGSATWPTDQPYMHWRHLQATVNEARERYSKYLEARDEIDGDPRLTPRGKAEERKKAALKALVAFEKSPTLHRTEESVTGVMSKWDAQLKAVIKPAWSESEALLHGELRRHLLAIKDPKARMSFLEQHGDDLRLATALLEVPPFLSGLSEAEAALIRSKIEAQPLPPEVAQAKKAVGDAMTACAHGWHRARDLIGEDAKLTKGPDGSWIQPEEAKG